MATEGFFVSKRGNQIRYLLCRYSWIDCTI